MLKLVQREYTFDVDDKYTATFMEDFTGTGIEDLHVIDEEGEDVENKDVLMLITCQIKDYIYKHENLN
jgi:hypothetical protein